MNSFIAQAKWVFAVMVFAITGCVSIPESVQGDFDNLSISQARKDAADMSVRWGGVIVKVLNESNQSVVEIVAKPLGSSTRPEDDDSTGGRFLAIFDDFIDPIIYTEGREITVVGSLGELVEGKVGEMDYLYPVVKATGHHLWRPRPEPRDVNIYSPSFWPYFPYRHYYMHWNFRPAPGTPGSRPSKPKPVPKSK